MKNNKINYLITKYIRIKSEITRLLLTTKKSSVVANLQDDSNMSKSTS